MQDGDDDRDFFDRLDRFPGTDECVLWPVEVGSSGAQNEGGDVREPTAMFATVDIDAVPRLRQAMERHTQGVALDVETQWHMAAHSDPAVSPLVFLKLKLPEFALVFHVGFVVDECMRSLAAAARTGMVVLIEPELSAALQVRPMEDALREHLSMMVSVPGVEPLRRALVQRTELPLAEDFGNREMYLGPLVGDDGRPPFHGAPRSAGRPVALLELGLGQP